MAKVLERSLYQADYYAWTKQQAAELRRLAAARADSTLDLANLAEEVESLGTSQLSGVKSQMRRVMEHLLKLEHSPGGGVVPERSPQRADAAPKPGRLSYQAQLSASPKSITCALSG